MKRMVALLMILVIAVGLTACASTQPYETKVAGVTLQVDPLKKMLIHGEDVYQYSCPDGKIWITYPNGYTYIWNPERNEGYGTGQSDSGKYLNEAVLIAALPEGVREESTTWIVVVSAIFALMGLWHVLLPRKSLFMLAYGWGVWKAEESPRNVRAIRMIGAVMVAAAVFCIVLA